MASLVSRAQDNSVTTIYAQKSVWLIGFCFVLSGATGLIYEVLWARMLGLVFGATTLAVSTVLAAFMGGLALGSALAGRAAPRIRRPFRAYGLLELGIALYALAVPFLFSLVDNLYALVWQQYQPGFFAFSIWRFVLSCLMLLVPTTLMGATLPVLSAALMRSPIFKSTSVTRLYTCNLLGAIIGTLLAGFVLLPMFGVRSTIYIAALINIIIGVIAFLSDRDDSELLSSASASDVVNDDNRSLTSNVKIEAGAFWLFCAFVSGFVTISTQVAWTRVLTMIIGSSTYAFSIVVALFLIGLSLGAYVVGRNESITKNLRSTIFKLEIFTAISLVGSIFVINRIPALLVGLGLRFHISSWIGLLALQIGSAALLILLPSFLMGMVMPLVLVWASGHSAAHSVRLVGRTYAVNTVGAIVGAFSAGFILIPKLTIKFTIVFTAAMCVITAGLAYEARVKEGEAALKRAIAVGLSVAVAFALMLRPPRINVADLSIGAYDSLVRQLSKSSDAAAEAVKNTQGPQGHEVLMYQEGTTATVSVRKDWDIISLAINGRTNASDKEDMPTQVMLGQLPLLLAPNIKNAMVVGLASGVTLGAMLQSPIESLDCVELEPSTIQASHFFEHVNNQPLRDPRLRVIIDDARTYLRVTNTRYDMIVSEPSHPWVPGVANLFTREFFELGRGKLTDTGVFAQWLQIYQMSTDSLRSILATYHKVFPHVQIFRVGGAGRGKDLILLGSMKPLTLDLMRERIKDPLINAELTRVAMATESDVRAWYVCDDTRLAPAVAGAVINTDDNMHIETTVPREAFLPLMQMNGEWIRQLQVSTISR
jgi:spermidine synthase